MSRGLRRLPTRLAAEAVARCVRELAAATALVFAALDELARPLAAAWQEGPRPLSTERLSSLQGDVVAQMDVQPAFTGAGYVLTESALRDQPRYLEWWNRAPGGRYEPLILDLDPASADHYDYYAMEWFFAAVHEQRRFVSGPLIDLPCSNVCILTFSTPVVVDGFLVGIAGADVALARLEPLLLPPMRRLGVPAVLVNRERRVISSNDARWTTGEKLPPFADDASAGWQEVVDITDDLGWRLAIAPG